MFAHLFFEHLGTSRTSGVGFGFYGVLPPFLVETCGTSRFLAAGFWFYNVCSPCLVDPCGIRRNFCFGSPLVLSVVGRVDPQIAAVVCESLASAGWSTTSQERRCAIEWTRCRSVAPLALFVASFLSQHLPNAAVRQPELFAAPRAAVMSLRCECCSWLFR